MEQIVESSEVSMMSTTRKVHGFQDALSRSFISTDSFCNCVTVERFFADSPIDIERTSLPTGYMVRPAT